MHTRHHAALALNGHETEAIFLSGLRSLGERRAAGHGPSAPLVAQSHTSWGARDGRPPAQEKGTADPRDPAPGQIAPDQTAPGQKGPDKTEPVQQVLDQHGVLASLIEEMARSERLDALAHQVDQIAHEVGTPLSTLYGHLQLALADPNLPASLRPGLDVAAKEAVRITNIVRRHLDAARHQRPRVEVIRFTAFISELLQESNAREGNARPLSLAVEPAAEHPNVDCRALRQLLQGLLQNLVSRLGPEDGVRCMAVRAGQDLVIRLEGTSPGAPGSAGPATGGRAWPYSSPAASSPDAPTMPAAPAHSAVLEARAGCESMPPALLVRIPAFALSS